MCALVTPSLNEHLSRVSTEVITYDITLKSLSHNLSTRWVTCHIQHREPMATDAHTRRYSSRSVGHKVMFYCRTLLEFSNIIANIVTFIIGIAHITNSRNVHQQLQNMLYTPILLTCTKNRLCLVEADCVLLS